MRREVPMRTPMDAQTRAWFLVAAFLCALYGAAGFGLGALVFHDEPAVVHCDVKPENVIPPGTAAPLGSVEMNAIPKATGAALQDSIITDSVSVLTVGNTANLLDGCTCGPCPDSCSTQPNGMTFCFANACCDCPEGSAEKPYKSAMTVMGAAFKDGDMWRRYDDVTLLGDGWKCKRVRGETKCTNGAKK